MNPNPEHKNDSSSDENPYNTILSAGLAPPPLMSKGMMGGGMMGGGMMGGGMMGMGGNHVPAETAKIDPIYGLTSSLSKSMSMFQMFAPSVSSRQLNPALVLANVVDGLAAAGNKSCKKKQEACKGSVTGAALLQKGSKK